MDFLKLSKFFAFIALVAVILSYPRPVGAVSTNIFSSPDSFIVKIQERFEYIFAFKVENKIAVLERQADKRLVLAQSYIDEKNDQKLQSVMQSYLQIKEKQNDLLEKIDDEKVLSKVEEKTVAQQKTMEEIKTKINEVGKQNVVKIQEQVVNQVAERVVATNGTEGATEFLNEVAHVWAPGTGPGGEAGVVYEGGGKLMFAPGTSQGGPAGADIKTVEIKTDSGEGGALAPGTTSGDGTTTGGGLAPGTTQDGGNTNPVTNSIDPGGVDPGGSSDGETWLAP